MENINLNILNHISGYKDILSGFACEFLYLFGITVNFFLTFYAHKKKVLKEISDYLVTSIFTLAFVALFYFDFYKSAYTLDSGTVIKFFLNLFFLFFAFATNPLTAKFKHKAVNQNTALLFIALFAFLLLRYTHPLILFILLDLTVFYIYRYGLDLRIIKTERKLKNFLSISITASVIFYVLYGVSLLLDSAIQADIVQTCMACAVLLKIGIFPLFNYSINNQDKSDIGFSILLFGILPFLGAIVFSQIIQNFNNNTELFKLTLISIILVSAFSFALGAFWQKDLVKLISRCECFFVSFIILNIMFGYIDMCKIELLFLYLFCSLGIFSILSVLKMNSNKKKITSNLVKGLYYANKPLSHLLCIILLMYLSVIPNKILFSNIAVLKNLYNVNVLGIYLCFIFVVLNVLILLNVIKIIQNIYFLTFKPVIEFKKAITPNYVIAFLIIVFMLVSCCL